MSAKRIFFLSSGRLVAHHWHRGQFTERYVFRADEDGLTQFAQYLSSTPPDPVSLLVDVVEEEFREETIPHVMGTDRKALLRNKKTRLFRDATYSYASVQGRETEGRRDDKVLFTALIRPDMLAPWLGQMARLKVPLTGIYSLPLLSELLLKKLKLTDSHVLLVSMHSTGGLRQTFLQEQQLKLSRLAMTPDVGQARYPSYILGEVEKLRRYLGSLRLLPRDTPLEVHVISEGGTVEELSRQASDSITTRHHFHSTEEVAKKLGLRNLTEPVNTELLFAHLLAKGSLKNHYAPERETRYFSLQRARTGMIAASWLLLLVGICFAGYKFVEIVNTKQESLVVKRQTVFYTERLRLARESLPPAPALAHDIQMVVEMADTLRDYRSSPVKMMVTLSLGLERFPGLHVETIEWVATADPNVRVGGSSASRAQSGLALAESGSQYHVAHIAGRLLPFDGDYRQALETISRFVDSLSRQEQVETVQAIKLPIDTSSQQRLLGSAGSGSRSGEADFEVRVVIKSRAAQPT